MTNPVRGCPVCGQNAARILFRPTKSPGPISKCENCEMVYVAAIDDPHALIFDGPVIYDGFDKNILTSSNLNDVKDAWELKHIADKEAEFPYLRQNALNALQRIETYTGKPINQRILDFGSGFGFFLSVAKACGWKAYGIEPLFAAAVYARAKFGLNIITDILHENIYQEEYFDVVTSFQVFEHLPYPRENLKCLSKLIKKNGIIFIEVPRYDSWTMKFLRSRHRHFAQDHLNFFSYETLSLILKNNGFAVLESYQPKRIMSVRHLFSFWIMHKLPKVFSQAGQTILQLSGFWDKTLDINIGDMLTVIGRKR